jgi:hypothetical protein
MDGRRLCDAVGLSNRSRFIGELIVAVLEARGPLEARQLLEPISQVEHMRRYSVRSIGSIAGKVPGVIMVKERPRALFDIIPGRKPNLPKRTQNRIDQVNSRYSPPSGED